MQGAIQVLCFTFLLYHPISTIMHTNMDINHWHCW